MPPPCGGCQRGAPYTGAYEHPRQCRLCWLYANEATFRAKWDSQPTPPPDPNPGTLAVPEADWPFLVRVVARRRQPGERGVGDTLQRLIGHLGGEVFKRAFHKLTGRDCGCGNRAIKLNLMYPYAGSASEVPHDP